MRVRIRWSQASLALLGVATILLALRVASSFLQPPAPAPLPADVGLPRIEARSDPEVSRLQKEVISDGGSKSESERRLGRVVSGGGARRRAEASEGRATQHRAHRPDPRRSAQHKPGAPTRRQDPPANPSVPKPVPPPEVSPPPVS